MRRWSLLLAFCCSLLSASLAQAAEMSYIWREAESADQANIDLHATAPPAHPELISGGTWLVKSYDPAEMGREQNPDVALTYQLQAPKTEHYHFWLRVGYEFVRPNMRWRLDGGAWQTISNKTLTRDMIELSFWSEIGWLDVATVEMAAGPHTLELVADEWNITIGKDKTVSKRFLLALDVLAFVAGDWTPCANLKPGEEPAGDVDTKAAAHRFTLPLNTTPGARSEVSLTGLWQACRDDDMDMNQETYAAVQALPPPAHQHWHGLNIPPNKWMPPPAALEYAHRVWYRARVMVPAEYAGRSFYLHFFGTNWIASVVVNGRYIGMHKSVRVPWDIDVTPAITPGQVNEIDVNIKDLWYGIDVTGSNDPLKLNGTRNIPLSFVQKFTKIVAPFFPSTKGDADGTVCGITDWVNLVVAGQVYTGSVAIRPSVAKHTLTVAAEVVNPTAKDAAVAIGTEAVLDGTDAVEQQIPPVTVTVPAGGRTTVTLSAPWEHPKLWWPGVDPAPIYRLRTTIRQGDTPLDIFEHEQRFGFCEVTVDGIYLRVNGLRRNFWNLGGGLTGDTDAEMLAHYRLANNRFERFGDDLKLRDKLGPRCYQLDWMDKHGIAGRLSTMIDGMSIAYNLRNPVTWENFNEHIDQVTKAYRNHPSIIVYSLENELLLINGRLGNGNIMDTVIEPAAKKLQEIAHRNDPTRPCMLDGAGALKDQSMDICCTHYAEDGFCGDNAKPLGDTDPKAPGITIDPNWRGANPSGFCGLWRWDHQRPYCAGEIAYFSGNNGDHAWIGGADACVNRSEALHAYARYIRYLFQRYRWNDIAITCPWTPQDGSEECWNAMSPLAAFPRYYNASFFAGEPVAVPVKVFNDTFSPVPLTFTWRLEVDGKQVAGNTQTLTITPGFGQETTVTFTTPAVATRTPARLTLEVTQPDSTPFTESHACTLYPRLKKLTTQHALFVLAPEAPLLQKLTTLGVAATPVHGVGEITEHDAILLIPPDCAQPFAPLVAYAAGGGRVVFLEQNKPLDQSTVPLPLTVAKAPVYLTFPEGEYTGLLADLGETELFSWAGGGPSTRVLWQKPGGAVRAWIVAGANLAQCALIETAYGNGTIIATQMRVGEKLEIEPAAQVLLANMLRQADSYQPSRKVVRVYAQPRSKLEQSLLALGLKTRDDMPLEKALTDSQTAPILLVQATNDQLEALLKVKQTVEQYVESGGWIVFWGLAPDGLPAYNTLLGTRHALREFRVEPVRVRHDPLTAGFDSADLAQLSNVVIAQWSGMKRISGDIYSYCVDANNDIAPFGFGPPNPNYSWGEMGGGPYMLVNGLRNNDFWMYIDQFGFDPHAKGGQLVHAFTLPAPCKLDHITVWNNANYELIKELEVRVDDQPALTLQLPKSSASVDGDLHGLTANKSVSLYVKSTWSGRGGLVGLDEVQLFRQTPDWCRDRVVPLDNLGGLVRYPRGKGGFVLDQVKLLFSERDEYLQGKLRTLTGILQNLGAAFNIPDKADAGAGDAGPAADL